MAPEPPDGEAGKDAVRRAHAATEDAADEFDLEGSPAALPAGRVEVGAGGNGERLDIGFASGVRVEPGDEILIETANGGGWGAL